MMKCFHFFIFHGRFYKDTQTKPVAKGGGGGGGGGVFPPRETFFSLVPPPTLIHPCKKKN